MRDLLITVLGVLGTVLLIAGLGLIGNVLLAVAANVTGQDVETGAGGAVMGVLLTVAAIGVIAAWAGLRRAHASTLKRGG